MIKESIHRDGEGVGVELNNNVYMYKECPVATRIQIITPQELAIN